jgi:phospholipid/cholesterol/gamma-HCH transport system ATP-binding protein
MEAKPNNPNSPVIEMSGVDVGSWLDSEQTVLVDVNWKVAPGEYWVIAGMHGSGKQDLMFQAAGFTVPQRGTCRLFGYDAPMHGRDLLTQRLRLGLVFGNGQLLRHLSIKENIALPLRYHRQMDVSEIEDRLKAVLELTELTPYAEDMPGATAPYWQKRAGLARSLIMEPEALLVAQPLGGLDLRQSHWWVDFLDQLSSGHSLLQNRPLTLVVTTDDLRPWHNPKCQFAVLKKKHFIALGRRPEFASHQEPLVKELLAEPISKT